MKIKLKGTGVQITEAVRKYVQEKIDMLDKFLGNIAVLNCDVELAKSVGGQNKGQIFRTEVNLQVPGNVLRVEKTETDLYKAIDNVKGHLEGVIIKYKEKVRSKKRRLK